jgi:hypothetical protein
MCEVGEGAGPRWSAAVELVPRVGVVDRVVVVGVSRGRGKGGGLAGRVVRMVILASWRRR